MQSLKWILLSFSLLLTSGVYGAKSNFTSMLPYITEVKDQKGRNTCTVFTTVAMLETLYIQAGGDPNVDLSEEWVQYMASIKNASGGAKGSMVSTDLNSVKEVGIAAESELSYTQGEWTGQESEAQSTCASEGTPSPKNLTYVRCLYGKFPSSYISFSDQKLAPLPKGNTFIKARVSAQNWKSIFKNVKTSVINASDIKKYLDNNRPLALELNMFHGAWNTSKATSNGIGRSDKLYNAGIVTYPEEDSKDRSISPRLGNRHSVQIVGYDDDLVVKYELKMNDGSTKTFQRKGVYLFKNSWGTKKFGNNFRYNKKRIRGFGMILQDHVHDFGLVTAFY